MPKKLDKKMAILTVLKEQNEPVTSAQITNLLSLSGLDFSERTVRLHLKELDEAGLTIAHGRRGRRITDAGLAELQSSQISQRPGYLSAKIDQMIYRMTFDLPLRSGTVVVNTSMVDPYQLASCVEPVCSVFAKGYGMGRLMTLVGPGQTVGLPGQPLLQIPVTHGRVSVVVVGGLNPIAILEEQEHRVFSRALSGLIEFDRLFSYQELPARLQPFL